MIEAEAINEPCAIAPEDVARIWHVVEPMLRRGYEEVDEFMPDDLLPWLQGQKGPAGILWVCHDGEKLVAAITTSLERKPSGLVCRAVACGGEGGVVDWRATEERIARYAKDEGCVKVTAEGRNGWARLIPGYKAVRAHFEKVI